MTCSCGFLFALFLSPAHPFKFVEMGKDMKSVILNYKTYAATLAFGLLASPAFAAADGARDVGVNNIYNYLLGAGSLAVVGIGMWILYVNMKRKPRDDK